jgi:hypothetical protein
MEILKYLKWKKPMMTGMIITLSLVLGLCGLVAAQSVQRVVGTPAVTLLDSSGTEVTAATQLQFSNRVIIVCDGLKPNKNYSVQRGVTSGSTGINIALSTPSLAGDAGYDVQTDANGHFSATYTVEDIAGDSTPAKRTLTVHEGTGTNPGAALLTAVIFQIKPKVTLKLKEAAAYGQLDPYNNDITWKKIGFTSSEGKVNDTVANPIVGSADCPYEIEAHGFSGDVGYRKITFAMGGTDVPLWDGTARVTKVPLNENGALLAGVELAIPEIPAGEFPILAADGRSITTTVDFIVKPAILKGDISDPAQDIEILVRQDGVELEVTQDVPFVISGIGWPAGNISKDTIKVGDKVATHVLIQVPNNGTKTNIEVTPDEDTTPGVSNIVVKGNTFANVTVVGKAVPKDAVLSITGGDSLANAISTYTGLTAAILDVQDSTGLEVLFTIEDVNNTAPITPINPNPTGKYAANGIVDDDVIFQFDLPDFPNTYTEVGELEPVTMHVGVDALGGGDILDELKTNHASESIFVAPNVVAGLDGDSNRNIDEDEIQAGSTTGGYLAIDIRGFVKGETVQVAVEGIPHIPLNANGSFPYNGTTYPRLGAVVGTYGATVESGTSNNALILIRLGDTNGDDYLTDDDDISLASGPHEIKVSGSTFGSSATTSITISGITASLRQTSSTVYSYAPVGAIKCGGVQPTTVNDSSAPFDVIPGGIARLSVLEQTGQNFNSSAAYLILFEERRDTLNLIPVGEFTSTPDGRIPLNTAFTVPDTALPGTHNVLIAEDTNGNGEYDSEPIVFGPNKLTVEVFANVTLDNYIKHVEDTVTISIVGLNPGNTPDATQATKYQILVDSLSDGIDITDPVFPVEGFTPDQDGKAQFSFAVPDIPGGTIRLFVVEKGTLIRTEPLTLINAQNVIGETVSCSDGVDEDAEIYVTPSIVLDKYAGDKGEQVTVSGKGFIPNLSYVVTFGFINDCAIEQRGQVVTQFTADSNGRVPANITFTVPTANNAAFGVVVDPLPAGNAVDIAENTPVCLDSTLLAGDQAIFTVGGECAAVESATKITDTTVNVKFSGALNKGSAETASNYSVKEKVSGTPVQVLSATYDNATTSVTLTLGAACEEGKDYVVTVSNVLDIINCTVSGQAEYACGEPPCETWQDVVKKYTDCYLTGDCVWQDVLDCYDEYVGS